MPQPALRVGGDIDAFCSRCKMLLGHTILAMVSSKPARVRCDTCKGEHVYKAGPPGTPAPGKKGSWQPRAVRERPQVTSWEARLAQKDLSRARSYSAKETFAVSEVLQHPTFGIGLVEEVHGDKMKVAFKADVKTLVHGKR